MHKTTKMHVVSFRQLNIQIIEPAHDKTNKMVCAPRKDWTAWASTQADQSLFCLHEESLRP